MRMDLPKAAVAEAWDSQAFAAAARATTPFGNPDLASSFTNDELVPWARRFSRSATPTTAWKTAWCSIRRRVTSTRQRWFLRAREICHPAHGDDHPVFGRD